MPAKIAEPQPSDVTPRASGRRLQVRRSGVHGKGVFAVGDIAEGERLMEYVGEIISWKEALRRHPHDPSQPNHTFYFHIDDKHVIDGNVGGNASRWINHSCEPNCQADEDEGRVFINALRDIRIGEELNYDYGLIIDAPLTRKLKAEYPCWCGSTRCRGTLLAAGQRKTRTKSKGKGKGKTKSSTAGQRQASGKRQAGRDARRQALDAAGHKSAREAKASAKPLRKSGAGSTEARSKAGAQRPARPTQSLRRSARAAA